MADILTKPYLFVMCICAHYIISVTTFNLEILHTNDVHSRIEHINIFGSSCSQQDAIDGNCYGGVARQLTKIQEIRNTGDNVILLDAGNQFMGTLWFNVYRGQAPALFMEQLGYDAMCLGNQEFDLGDQVLADFIENVTFPVISANIETTTGSPLHGTFAKSVTLTVVGEKIGIVGYTTEDTAFISSPSNNVQFTDVIESVQREVNRLTRKGINKIIALGHAGYELDLDVAKIEGVDVVVGGHTGTFLYTGNPPSIEVPEGPYPTVVTQESGKRVLVVQDYTYGKYLGYLNVTFDSMGVVEAWSGNPIILDSTISEDPTTKALVDEMAKKVVAQNSKIVGETKVLLDNDDRSQETNIANLLLDAVIDYHLDFPHPDKSWAPASIAVWNAGGIRTSIPKGNVTYGDVNSVLPFGNKVDLIKVLGSNLRDMLEYSVKGYTPGDLKYSFLHVSGLRIVYNLRHVERRILSVDVLCLECDVPRYLPLVDDQEYKLFTNAFIIRGGDGYTFQPIEQIRFGSLEADILADYFQRHSPVYASLEGRITFEDFSNIPPPFINLG